jgi:hypothetical protein
VRDEAGHLLDEGHLRLEATVLQRHLYEWDLVDQLRALRHLLGHAVRALLV